MSANESILSLSGFEVLPDTPASVRNVHFEDFSEPSPAMQSYCHQLSLKDYEEQSCSYTEKALLDLIEHLERDPTVFKNLVRKRKREEMEQNGIVSFLKIRLMAKLKGEKYKENLVSENECEEKLAEIKTGMLMAHNYSKESRCVGQRFSQRLREKRCRTGSGGSPQLCGAAPPPPPPPPCPPPPLTPTTHNTTPSTPSLARPPIRKDLLQRTDSLQSVHEELKSINPLKHLKAVRTPRTPLGRRLLNESADLTTPARLDSSEPLTAAFLRIMEAKFRNVRSPSPATNTTADATMDFSP